MWQTVQGRRTTTQSFVKSLWSSTPKDSIVNGKLIKEEKKTPSTNNTPIQAMTFTYGQMTTFWIIGVLVSYAGYLAFNSLALLYLILAGLLISVAMEVFIQWGSKYIPRGLSIGIVYLLFVLFLLTGMFIILPFLIQQATIMMSSVIASISSIGQDISILGLQGYISTQQRLGLDLQNYIIEFINSESINSQRLQNTIIENISTLVSTGTDYIKYLSGAIVIVIGGLFNGVAKLGLVLIMAIFFSIEKDEVRKFFVQQTHSTEGSRLSQFNHKIDIFYNKMGSWIKTQFALCFYVGLLVYISLLILSLFGIDLPNKFALALMAGFTEIIPYLGPIMGAIPAAIVATSLYGLQGLISVVIVYSLIQWAENYILVPLTMNKSLGVSPLLILLSALLGASILGLIGVLLAVPFAIIITIITTKNDQGKKS